MLKRLLLAACLVFSGSAYAEQWVPISEDTDGFIYFIDADSLTLDDDRVGFRIQSLFNYPADFPKNKMERVNGQVVHHTTAAFTADCGTGELTGPYSWTAYGAGDRVIDSMKDESPETMVFLPDTVGSSWVEAACLLYDDFFLMHAGDRYFI